VRLPRAKGSNVRNAPTDFLDETTVAYARAVGVEIGVVGEIAA